MTNAQTAAQSFEHGTDMTPPPGPPRKQLRWRAANAAWRILRSAWRFVRQVSGDDAYERYREHMLHAHAAQPAMTRKDYYRFRTEQKWNRVTRCC